MNESNALLVVYFHNTGSVQTRLLAEAKIEFIQLYYF